MYALTDRFMDKHYGADKISAAARVCKQTQRGICQPHERVIGFAPVKETKP